MTAIFDGLEKAYEPVRLAGTLTPETAPVYLGMSQGNRDILTSSIKKLKRKMLKGRLSEIGDCVNERRDRPRALRLRTLRRV
jgi:hypothetical protein